MKGFKLSSLKDEQWMSVCVAGMNLDTKGLFNVLPRKQPKADGYITPPLQCPSAPSRSSGKRLVVVTLLVLMLLYMCGFTVPGFRGGNQKVVIILAANLGGGSPAPETFLTVGVLDVKNPGDWAMEKWSIKNKKDYAGRHGIYCFEKPLIEPIGYELIVKDMSLKRKYAHEWRESWEKIDTIRDVMHQFPHHEWFWWLDLVYSLHLWC